MPQGSRENITGHMSEGHSKKQSNFHFITLKGEFTGTIFMRVVRIVKILEEAMQILIRDSMMTLSFQHAHHDLLKCYRLHFEMSGKLSAHMLGSDYHFVAPATCILSPK